MNTLNPEPEQTAESPHLREYYDILVKHRGIIFLSLILMVSLTMLFTFRMAPVYRSTATLVIDKEQSKSPLTGERMDYETYMSLSLTFNTHFKLITSRPVLEQTLRELDPERLSGEKGMETGLLSELLTRFKKNIRLLLGYEEKSLSPGERRARLIEKLKEKIEIEQIRDTRLLKVSVEDHDPSAAERLANSLSESYIAFNIENRLKSSRNTLSWMTKQLYEMKKKLEDAEQAFLAYKERQKLFSVEGKQKVIGQKIQEFNDAYLKARNRRLELDAMLEELQRSYRSGKDRIHIRSLTKNPLIESLYSQILDGEVELSRLSKVYRSKHPKVIQITTKIDDTRSKLDGEVRKEVKNLVTERSVLLAKEKVLQKTMADFETDALDTNRKELKYTILLRNVQTNQKLYDTLLSRVEESNILGNVDVTNIRVAERAEMPQGPIKPKKKRNLILSVLFGLMTGIGLAFLFEYLDRSFHTEEDIERYLGLPVLSVIPIADKGKGKN
ncbi:MAG: GumC family protein [Pseudomonadota bacterium]